jgi:hypothetical protein
MAAFRGHRATAKAVARCAAATQRRKARAHSTSRHLSAKLGRWSTVCQKGSVRMIRVVIDTVLFSCMGAFVTGIVIAAATFLI